jgi:hypothetical protein
MRTGWDFRCWQIEEFRLIGDGEKRLPRFFANGELRKCREALRAESFS